MGSVRNNMKIWGKMGRNPKMGNQAYPSSFENFTRMEIAPSTMISSWNYCDILAGIMKCMGTTCILRAKFYCLHFNLQGLWSSSYCGYWFAAHGSNWRCYPSAGRHYKCSNSWSGMDFSCPPHPRKRSTKTITYRFSMSN